MLMVWVEYWLDCQSVIVWLQSKESWTTKSELTSCASTTNEARNGTKIVRSGDWHHTCKLSKAWLPLIRCCHMCSRRRTSCAMQHPTIVIPTCSHVLLLLHGQQGVLLWAVPDHAEVPAWPRNTLEGMCAGQTRYLRHFQTMWYSFIDIGMYKDQIYLMGAL